MTIDKKDLIEKVDSIKSEIDVTKAIKDDENKNDKTKGVGTNQFRELASTCKACDTYDEVKLLVQYKTAKAKEKRNSWSIASDNHKMFGSIVVEKMDQIKDIYKSDGDETVLHALSLFFGYLYQSARVWKMETQPVEQKKNDKPNNNGHHKNFNNSKKGGKW